MDERQSQQGRWVSDIHVSGAKGLNSIPTAIRREGELAIRLLMEVEKRIPCLHQEIRVSIKTKLEFCHERLVQPALALLSARAVPPAPENQ